MTRFSQNNLIQVNADGSVDATFPGGITMFAATDTNPPTSRRIRWIRDTNGAVVAEQYTSEDFPFADSTHIVHHLTDAAKDQGILQMDVVDDTDVNQQAGVMVRTARGLPSFTDVEVHAYSGVALQQQRTVIGADGASSYVQANGSIRTCYLPVVFNVPAMAVNATAFGVGVGNTTTNAPFGSVLNYALMGAGVPAGGNNAQCMTWGTAIANNAGFLQFGLVAHNPSAFAIAASVWRGMMYAEW